MYAPHGRSDSVRDGKEESQDGYTLQQGSCEAESYNISAMSSGCRKPLQLTTVSPSALLDPAPRLVGVHAFRLKVWLVEVLAGL